MQEHLKRIYSPEKDIFGHPQIYKEIKLYPILLKDLEMQDIFYKVFARPKNYIPDVQVLKTSYLKFLIYVLSEVFGPTGQEVVDSIIKILEYITKSVGVQILVRQVNNNGTLDSVELKIKIGEILLSESDFENIREIVLEQNSLSIEYVESYNPELEPALEFMNRNSSNITLQDQIFTFCSIMKISLSEIEKYTLFQFNNMMEKILTLKEYDLYKPLLVSGQITLKSGDIKHYLYHSEKTGRYDSILMNKDAFLEKNKDTFG